MFRNIKYTLLSMFVVFKHLFKRPVTLEYPEKKKPVGKYFRGKPVVSNCIKCKTCTKVCPTGAIKLSENEIKIDLKRCIFCGNCSFYCPKGSIKMSEEYELATDSKNDLELIYTLEETGGENERNR